MPKWQLVFCSHAATHQVINLGDVCPFSAEAGGRRATAPTPKGQESLARLRRGQRSSRKGPSRAVWAAEPSRAAELAALAANQQLPLWDARESSEVGLLSIQDQPAAPPLLEDAPVPALQSETAIS